MVDVFHVKEQALISEQEFSQLSFARHLRGFLMADGNEELLSSILEADGTLKKKYQRMVDANENYRQFFQEQYQLTP